MLWKGFLFFFLVINCASSKKYGDDICSLCSCYRNFGNEKTVDCSKKSLTSMPEFNPRYISASIMWYKLGYNSITHVSNGYLKPFPNLRALDLSSNKISFIPQDLLKNQPKLQSLYISNNRISNIPKHVFRNTPNLSFLLIENNKISSIPPDVFRNTPNLQYLSTSGLIDCCNAYRMIPGLWECNDRLPPFKECGVKLVPNNPTFGKRISVGKVLVYNDGNWSTICNKNWTKANADVTCKDLGFPGAIEQFSLLSENTIISTEYRCTGDEIYLIKCPIKDHISTKLTCPKAAGVRCKDEEKLICNVCNCTTSYVDCSARGIQHVPWSNSNFGENITRLDMSNNNLINVWTGFLDMFPRLQYLSFRNNSLNILDPKSLEKLENLKALDLTSNRLENLPQPLFRIDNRLEYLSFRNNFLKILDPKSLENLENLKELDISEMPGLNITDWKFLSKMKKLKELRASVFSQCCIVKRVRPDVNCITPEDSLSECKSIIKSRKPQYIVWVIIVAVLGGGTAAVVLKIKT